MKKSKEQTKYTEVKTGPASRSKPERIAARHAHIEGLARSNPAALPEWDLDSTAENADWIKQAGEDK